MINKLSPQRLHLLKGIARGEQAIREGRTFTHAQARKRLTQKLRKLSPLFAKAPLAQIIAPRSKESTPPRSQFK